MNAFVCGSWEVARAASSGCKNLLLPHFRRHFVSSSLQAPFMLYKPALGSTTWVLAAILLQNITKSLLGWCFIDDAWYFLLGWRLIQVFLALCYLSTPQAMLQCPCSALPPVLCAHNWSHLTWEGPKAFLLAAVFGQDHSGLKETSCFFCSNSVLPAKAGSREWLWRAWSL